MATQVLGRSDIGRAVTLGTTQSGNGSSTDILDRGKSTGPMLVELVSVAGATPTVTMSLQGSADGTNFFNVPYSLPATFATVTQADPAAITTSTTTRYMVASGYPYRYFKTVRASNTNVTITTNVYAY